MEQEKQWICGIRQSNMTAFRAVYDHYADKVFYLSVRMRLSQQEAKDMVQNVFLTLWEKREKLDDQFSLNAYLLTIAKNKIINLHKKKAVESAGILLNLSYAEPFSNTTLDEMMYAEMEKQTLSYINQLPSRNKQIFLMSRQEGLRNEEIARTLKLSKRTVENNLYQAEASIRRFINKLRLLERSYSIPLAIVGIFL